MRASCLVLLGLIVLTTSISAFACPGAPDCPTHVYKAEYGSDHNIFGVFGSYSADFTDYVRLVDTTQNLKSAWILAEPGRNGCSLCIFFGIGSGVHAGDTLVMEICSIQLNGGSCSGDPAVMFASDPSYSSDGVNHVYLRNPSGMCTITNNSNFGATCPVGFEDLSAAYNSDWDFNDAQMTLYNVLSVNASAGAATPEPTSFALMGSGIVLLATSIRRRLMSR